MLLFVALPFVAEAQGEPATITFRFSNPALQPASYTMLLREDGTGHYHSEPGSSPAPENRLAAGEALDREITLVDPLRKQLFAAARRNHLFAVACEKKKGNLAFTGNKTLSFSGSEGEGNCTFNYAQDAQLQGIANNLIAVATTLEEGRKLELLLAHDKLGLDAAMGDLLQEQANGQAIDLQNIAPILQQVADSQEVLNRTRGRAETLLATTSFNGKSSQN